MEFFNGNVLTLQSVTSGGFLRTHADHSIDTRAKESDPQARWVVEPVFSSPSSSKFRLRSVWKPSQYLCISKLNGKLTGAGVGVEYEIVAEPFQMNTFKLIGKYGTVAFDEHGVVCSAANPSATKLIVKIVDGLFSPGKVVNIRSFSTGRYINVSQRPKGKGLDPTTLDTVSANGSASHEGSKFVVLSEGVCHTLGRKGGAGFIRLQTINDRTKFLALNKDKSLAVKAGSSSDTHFYINVTSKGSFSLEQAHGNGLVAFSKDGFPVRSNCVVSKSTEAQFTVSECAGTAPVPGRPEEYHFTRMVVTLQNAEKKDLYAKTFSAIFAELYQKYSKKASMPEVATISNTMSPNTLALDLVIRNDIFPVFFKDILDSAPMSALKIKDDREKNTTGGDKEKYNFGKRSVQVLVLGNLTEAAKATYAKMKTAIPGSTVSIKYDVIGAGWIQKPRAKNFSVRFGTEYFTSAGLLQFKTKEDCDKCLSYQKDFAAKSAFPGPSTWFFYQIAPNVLLHFAMSTVKHDDEVSAYCGQAEDFMNHMMMVKSGTYDFAGHVSDTLKAKMAPWEDNLPLKMCYPIVHGGWVASRPVPGAPEEVLFNELTYKFNSNGDLLKFADALKKWYENGESAVVFKHWMVYEKNPLTLSFSWTASNKQQQLQNEDNVRRFTVGDPPRWFLLFSTVKELECICVGNPSLDTRDAFKWWQTNTPSMKFVKYVTPLCGWTYALDKQGENEYFFSRTEVIFRNKFDMNAFVERMQDMLEFEEDNEINFIQYLSDTKVSLTQVYDNEEFALYIRSLLFNKELVRCFKNAKSTTIEAVGNINEVSRSIFDYIQGNLHSDAAQFFEFDGDTQDLNVTVLYPELLAGYAHKTA
eukprot:UC4_evm1s616